MTEGELRSIAHDYILFRGAAGDERISVGEVMEDDELTEAEARRVLHLITYANVTVSWGD